VTGNEGEENVLPTTWLGEEVMEEVFALTEFIEEGLPTPLSPLTARNAELN
jgi:hypothetical protein